MAKALHEINNVIPFPTRRMPQLLCSCAFPSGVHMTNVGFVCNRCLLPAKEGC